MSLFYSAGLGGTAIPDSGISRYEFEQDVTDSWGDNDGTDNTSAGYTTDAAVGSYAKSFDGVDDVVPLGNNAIDPTRTNLSVSIWANKDDTSDATLVDLHSRVLIQF